MDKIIIRNLRTELKKLQRKVSRADLPDPKDLRRIDKINSIILTGDINADLNWKVSKGKESKRVTSFTKDRR